MIDIGIRMPHTSRTEPVADGDVSGQVAATTAR